MPRQTINYENTIIYKIVCNDLDIKDCYIGHTTDFAKRKYKHKNCCSNANSKNHNLKIYEFIRENGGWENWNMLEIEKFECDDGNEARARERFYYEKLNSNLNNQVPNRSYKEYKEKYRVDNIDKIKEADKQYRINNKHKIKEADKQYRINNKDKIKEYYTENIDKVKEKNKLYYSENKDKINEKNKVKDSCTCGGNYRHSDKARHFKTLKHQQYIKHQDETTI